MGLRLSASSEGSDSNVTLRKTSWKPISQSSSEDRGRELPLSRPQPSRNCEFSNQTAKLDGSPMAPVSIQPAKMEASPMTGAKADTTRNDTHLDQRIPLDEKQDIQLNSSRVPQSRPNQVPALTEVLKDQGSAHPGHGGLSSLPPRLPGADIAVVAPNAQDTALFQRPCWRSLRPCRPLAACPRWPSCS